MSANSAPRGCHVSNLSLGTLTHCSYGPELGHVKLVRIHPVLNPCAAKNRDCGPRNRDIGDIGF
jgi:hypothetical protein